jgi:deazaflavin-dependent oxidoreductase (nitroreductase family)
MIKPQHTEAAFGYLTTTGRRSGNPHTVEIWFAVAAETFYLLSGGGGSSDWCRNLEAEPSATFRIARTEYQVAGRRVRTPKEQRLARHAVFAKYDARSNGDLVEWRDASAPYALDPIA